MNNKTLTGVDDNSACTIRAANLNEMPQVCDILASAFKDDPVMAWISGHPKIYSGLFRSEAEALYKNHGHVYINGDKTGAAMWLPAGVSHKAPFHWRLLTVAWQLFSTGGFTSLKRGLKLESIFSRHHIKEPHFYLHAVGAAQNNQGRGIGSALLRAGLAACDKQCLPAYLESSNKKNNPLYERFGFRVIGEIALPDNGPTVWLMRREVKQDK